jgi:FdhD protein
MGPAARRAPFTTRGVVRSSAGARTPGEEAVAVEEPLEIRIAGEPLVVTMRTPGDDPQLAVGFLFSEGLIDGAMDLGTVAHCGRPGEEGYGNAIDIVPAPGAQLDMERLSPFRRGTLTTSACGVCGRRTIDELLSILGAAQQTGQVPAAAVLGACAALEQVQGLFARTGGCHAALVADSRGQLLLGREDIGRHNAVDKVIGALVLEGLRREPGFRTAQGLARPPAVLMVSGRASFEIVQKAAAARIPVVASVSAPSSLAIDLAARAGLTLAGFVREGRMSLYTHPERIVA